MEKFQSSSRCASTPLEPWTLERPMGEGRKAYAAAADFMGNLGNGEGRTCLMIGCPVFATKEMAGRDWDVTYMDVRKPPVDLPKFVQSCATQTPFEDESFDAITSSCVLSHVGMGRYGDPVVSSGDLIALQHMVRVLKPGAQAAIMFGNVAKMPKTIRLGTCHRIYALDDVKAMLGALPVEVEKTSFWSPVTKQWFDDPAQITEDWHGSPDYVSVLIRKQCAPKS